jgi:hypothetical protein
MIFGLCMQGPALAARNTNAAGGLGGAPFRSVCKPNDVVIGFNVRYGAALDAIVPICIPLNPQRTEWAGQAYEPTGYFGGRGGSYLKLACQPGDAVRLINVWTGPWGSGTVTKALVVTCFDLESGKETTGESTQLQWLDTTYRTIHGIGCEPGEWVTGIFGRSGALVDQLGLVCDTIRPAAPPKPDRPIGPIGRKPTQPAPQAPEPGRPGPGRASVVLDVDVYKAPGQGNSIGVLRKGSDVLKIRCTGDNWCHVAGSAVPSGQGWVYNGPDYRSLQF